MSKLSYNHCEVHCNMIIFMLCHCVVNYNEFEGKPLRMGPTSLHTRTKHPVPMLVALVNQN